MRRPQARFSSTAPGEPLMAWPDRLGPALSRGSGSLGIKCEDCGHTAQMSGGMALNKFGERAMPSDVRKRLRCSACGSKRCWVWM